MKARIHFVSNNAYNGLVFERDGRLVSFITDGPCVDCRKISEQASAGWDDWDLGLSGEDETILAEQAAKEAAEESGEEYIWGRADATSIDLDDPKWVDVAIRAIGEEIQVIE